MTRRLLTVAALAAAFGVVAAPSHAQMRWDLPTEQAQSSLTGIADLAFAEAVKEKTGGEIEVTVHFGGSLGYKTKDQYDAVSSGALILADSYTGPLVGFDPIWQISALPFLTSSIADARLLYEAAKPTYEATLAADNMVLLYTIPWTASGIWANKEVSSLEALSGLKIRTYDPLGQMTFEAAGAAPITLSFADVVPQLTTGGIEAVLTSAEGGFHNKFADLLSHYNEINYASPLSIVHINRDAWEDLSPELQAAVLEAAAETEAMIWERAISREAENYQAMRDAGVTVVEGLPEDFLQALSDAGTGALAEWEGKAGETGSKIIADYRAKRGR